ncbi:MAG: hypothetical protein MRJ52_02440 [Nitrosomonas sp.]|jgi:hypothetical protein|nr:hypothetical protein [Nitrosomonas sp.]
MNNQKSTDKTLLTSINQHDIDDVAEFLHCHMNNRFTALEWKRGISRSWLQDAPNFGFMLKHENEIVGVLCAIYSEQPVKDGITKRFCNPHSWCVLADFRARSIDLVLALIRQKGYTFTMLSPNKEGIEIFRFLKFKPLNNEVAIFLNMPVVTTAGVVLNQQEIAQIKTVLPQQAAHHYVDHADFPWLNFLFFRSGDRYGFLIFKKQIHKRLSSAWILYISDAALFRQCWPAIRTALLLKHGLFFSKIESRLLDQPMKTALKPEHGHQKFYLGDEVSADCVQNLYSELVTLNL